ncbi:spore coat protein [Vallitalea maricola]|uniref:Spore coat protein n=1 Tax=Vallitalea maricola TaxID=3074433 RepID=A0ACB5UQM4_9FIRM|nr:spore coat protein [Vallitalea sp. AN17-2]
MGIQLTQKERMLLEDQKKQEDICVKKYKSFAEHAQDSELKELFNRLASEEQHHYDMVNQMLQGQEPDMSHSQQGQQPQSADNQNQGFQGAMSNQGDEVLCSDLLATEKYVSGTYDTAVFEAANPIVRQAIQHIQKDEQQHGQDLFNYMNSHGMYNIK